MADEHPTFCAICGYEPEHADDLDREHGAPICVHCVVEGVEEDNDAMFALEAEDAIDRADQGGDA